MVWTKFVNGTNPDADEMNANLTRIAYLNAISNFKILQANNVFQNGDCGFVEEYVDANGTNNTVNTGSSTAIWAVDNYSLLDESITINDLPLGSAAYAGGTIITTMNVIKGFWLYTLQIRNYTGNNTGTITLKKNGTTIASKSIGSGNTDIYFSKSDYSDFWEAGDTATIETVITGGGQIYYQNNTTTTNSLFSCSGTKFPYYSYSGPIVIWYSYDSLSGPRTVVHDTNTYTLDGTEAGIVIFSKNTLNGDSTITFDISDGTTTISGVNQGEYIDISSLSSGTLKVTATLDSATGGASNNPVLYGISVVALK